MKNIKLSILTLILVGSSLSASWFNNGKEVLPEYPLPTTERNVDNGGTLSIKVASADGIGVIITGNGLNNQNKVDNSSMNTLIYKYGEKADKASLSVADYVINEYNTKPGTISKKDFDYANQIKNDIKDSQLNIFNINPSFDILFNKSMISDPQNKVNVENNTIFGSRITGESVKVLSIDMQTLYDMGYRKLDFTVASGACGAGFFGDLKLYDTSVSTNALLDNYNYGYGPIKYTINLETKIASVEASYGRPAKTIDFSSYPLSTLHIGEYDLKAQNCAQVWDFNF